MSLSQLPPFITLVLTILALTGCSTTSRKIEGNSRSENQIGQSIPMPAHDPEVRKLLNEHRDAAIAVYKAELKKRERAQSTTEALVRTAGFVVNTEIALADTPEQVTAAWESQLKILKELDRMETNRVAFGLGELSDTDMMNYWRLGAEIEVLKWTRYGKSSAMQISPRQWSPERDPEIRRLLRERLEAATNANTFANFTLNHTKIKTAEQRLRMNKLYADTELLTARLIPDSELELAETPEQVIAAREKQVIARKALEAKQDWRINAGMLAPNEQQQDRYWRLTAELELLRAKREFGVTNGVL
jgi:hypothetical protein